MVYNVTRDCTYCGQGCRTPNTAAACGPALDCARVWAPEFHYEPALADAVPGSGGYFLTYHFHCSGGGSGLLRSTTGQPFGPYADLVHGVPGGDVSLFYDAPPTGDGGVYAVSSGAALYATRLTADLRAINHSGSLTLAANCDGECSRTSVGFEGPFLQQRNGTYYLAASAFGNATRHGGPRSIFNQPPAVSGCPDCYYSTYMGCASTLHGPYVDAVDRANPGGWLAVASGGHNVYFLDHAGALWATIWYGSNPGNDTPARDAPFIDLPSVVLMTNISGRLVSAGRPP